VLDAGVKIVGHRHDERIHLDRVRPAHRQRILATLTVEEEHSILRPRLPHRQQHRATDGTDGSPEQSGTHHRDRE
jgi:hypothetical protein